MSQAEGLQIQLFNNTFEKAEFPFTLQNALVFHP
jgi:hypothetical protein